MESLPETPNYQNPLENGLPSSNSGSIPSGISIGMLPKPEDLHSYQSLNNDILKRIFDMAESKQKNDFELQKEASLRETERVKAENLIGKRQQIYNLIIRLLLLLLSFYAIHSGHVVGGGVAACGTFTYKSVLSYLKRIPIKSRGG